MLNTWLRFKRSTRFAHRAMQPQRKSFLYNSEWVLAETKQEIDCHCQTRSITCVWLRWKIKRTAFKRDEAVVKACVKMRAGFFGRPS